ncbi:hypothetical protein DV737_g2756, partial [Chaetothyriales sp. CBS 132003]
MRFVLLLASTDGPCKTHALQTNRAGVILFFLTLYTSKLSAVALLYRFAPLKRHHHFILATIYARWVATTALDFASEIIILVLPIDMVWSLQMAVKSKLIVLGRFWLRIPVLVLAIGRLIYLHNLLSATDVGAASNLTTILQEVEMTSSLSATVILTLRPFAKEFDTGFGGGRETFAAYGYSNSNSNNNTLNSNCSTVASTGSRIASKFKLSSRKNSALPGHQDSGGVPLGDLQQMANDQPSEPVGSGKTQTSDLIKQTIDCKVEYEDQALPADQQRGKSHTRLEKNSTAVRKRIESHDFNDEEGEEYEASKFGGFGDYMRRKKVKLQNLDVEIRSQSHGKPLIFRGVVAHINGYTQPSLSDLHNLIVSHGGGFLQYLDGKTAVTHVIASHLTPKKKVEFARYRIVKPAWVVDSVKAGKLLPWDAYRLVDEGVTQKVLGFENGNIVSQVNSQGQGYRGQTEASWYTSHLKDHNQQKDPIEMDDDEVDVNVDGHAETVNRSEDSNEGAMEQDGDADTDLEPLEEPDDDAQLIKGGPEAPSKDLNHGLMAHVEAHDEVKIPVTDATHPEKRQLTAEEHNAILLSNVHMAKSSSANPDFINQYYRESRLHHLSTWKSELKARLLTRSQESPLYKARQKRAAGSRRYILHVDFDSFFAAVSLLKHPHLANKPVVVAHGSGPSSEIASCNYPARKFGIKNGMWMKTALERCPDLKVLPYDFKLYEEASRHFYDSILSIEGVVQSISIDEALIDVSEQCIKAGGSDGRTISEDSLHREQEKAQQIAQDLRRSVKDKTGCEVSVGIGANILLAKTALRKAKPAGQFLIKPEEVFEFLGDLVVTDLPGIAWSIGKKLEEIGVKYVKDIRCLTKERLMNHLGPKTGEKIWDYSRGIDKQEVGEQVVRKSVSAEINWGIRFINQQQAEDFVQSLCNELSKRLLEQAMKGRQLTMKIMRKAADADMDPPKSLGHGKCDTFNKSVVLGVATTDQSIIGKEAIYILRSYGFSPGELRGLGVQMQKLEPLNTTASTIQSPTDSSQRRLQFKKPGAAVSSRQLSTSAPLTKQASRPKLVDRADLLEEVQSPEKKGEVEQIRGAIRSMDVVEKPSPGKKPLNVAGTQFILSTQFDPEVLAELPADIRSRLVPRQKTILGSLVRPASAQRAAKSRSASPQASDGRYIPPNQSQLDSETLAELPDDVRKEVLAHYEGQNKKTRPVQSSKKLAITPTKKEKFSTLSTKGKSKISGPNISTLTQSNFVSMPKVVSCRPEAETMLDEEISQSFLDELPEDIRLEILAEQKRHRLKTKSGLNLAQTKRKPRSPMGGGSNTLRGQQKLKLPPKQPRPTFTSQKLSTLPELRDAMTAWVREFSEQDGEGPYDEDVAALSTYLERVVLDEGNMDKAVSLVKWLQHVWYLFGVVNSANFNRGTYDATSSSRAMCGANFNRDTPSRAQSRPQYTPPTSDITPSPRSATYPEGVALVKVSPDSILWPSYDFLTRPKLATIPEGDFPPSISVLTVEAAAAAKVFFETYFDTLVCGPNARQYRGWNLDQRLRQLQLPRQLQYRARRTLAVYESNNLRHYRRMKAAVLSRRKNASTSVGEYEVIKILGKGSFGVVRLVRQKDKVLVTRHGSWMLNLVKDPTRSGLRDLAEGPLASVAHGRVKLDKSKKEVYAMKVIRKSDMLRNSQEGHLRAERDFLVSAEGSQWIIPLLASFQDDNFLYLVMDFCIGGDFLGLLIRKNTLSEEITKWYVAEMILCVEEAHRMRWIHRDVKPDNFLVGADGHLKISDFGLAFDGRWDHDQKFYHKHRRDLMDILGIEVSGDEQDIREHEELENVSRVAGVLAKPQREYRHSTKLKILEHVHTLKFPLVDPAHQPSIEAIDLMKRLLTEKEKRICSRKYEVNNFTRKLVGGKSVRFAVDKIHHSYPGQFVYADDAEDLKGHGFFRNIKWDAMLTRRPPFVPKVKSWEDTKYFDDDEQTCSDIESASSDVEDTKHIPRVQMVAPVPSRGGKMEGASGSEAIQPRSKTSQHHHEVQHIIPSAAIKLNGGADSHTAVFTPGDKTPAWEEVKLENGCAAPSLKKMKREMKRPRDKVLRDPTVGPRALKLRKEGAFVGYEYRRPQAVDDVIKEVLSDADGCSKDSKGSSTARRLSPVGLDDYAHEQRVFAQHGGKMVWI